MTNISPTRVLVPYMLAFQGGVRRVLSEGLPCLNQQYGLVVEYAELCGNQKDMDEMEKSGAPVVRTVGVPGSGVLSYNKGVRRSIDLFCAIPRLIRLVLRLNSLAIEYDLIYVHGYRELMLTFLSLLPIPSQKRPFIVWHCHGIGDERPPLFMVQLANSCGCIIAISQSVADRLKEIGVREAITRVINNASSIGYKGDSFNSATSLLPEKQHGQFTILLPSSSIREVKGLTVAVQALAGLPCYVQLWITGDISDPSADEYKQELDNFIVMIGVRGRVHFIGRRTDIYDVMRQADLVLVPSLCREGFGLVAAEAMLLEKSVIVSNRGALPEVVDPAICGAIFDPEVPGDLQQRILSTLSNPELARERARLGKKRAEVLFNYDRWGSEVASILTLIMSLSVKGKR